MYTVIHPGQRNRYSPLGRRKICIRGVPNEIGGEQSAPPAQQSLFSPAGQRKLFLLTRRGVGKSIERYFSRNNIYFIGRLIGKSFPGSKTYRTYRTPLRCNKYLTPLRGAAQEKVSDASFPGRKMYRTQLRGNKEVSDAPSRRQKRYQTPLKTNCYAASSKPPHSR